MPIITTGSNSINISAGVGVVVKEGMRSRSSASDVLPLQFTTQPQSQSVVSGNQVTFTCVVAGGYSPYSYQWKKNGANVGTNSAALSFTAAAADKNASITVVVTDSIGTVITSTPVVLGVTSYAFLLDGISQYYSLNTTVALAVGDKTTIRFRSPTSWSGVRVLFCNAANSNIYKVYAGSNGAVVGLTGYHTAKFDGVSIVEGFNIPADGLVHEIEFTHLNAGDIKAIGATSAPNAFSNFPFLSAGFTRVSGNLFIPLNNKSLGAAQVATIGTRTANIVNYNASGWLAI